MASTKEAIDLHGKTRFMSASQIEALGKRLRKYPEARKEDRRFLQRLIADYVAPMAHIQDRVRAELGIESTARPKTEKTTIEKLRRDRTRLNKMQDLAGVRINGDMTLTQQDETVERLVSIFPEALVHDLRDKPGNAYRAVHVIPTVADCPVEIQVRTDLQHAWADLFERLADATDRRIRYGSVPRDPKARQLYETLVATSSVIATVEAGRDWLFKYIEEGKEVHAKFIEVGPGPPKGAPARTERDRMFRNLRDKLRRLHRRRDREDAQRKTLVRSMHDIAKAIRDGRLTFERGIVE